MKKCSSCKLYKDFDSFSKRSDSKDGYRGVCKKCINEKSKSISKKYYKNNREKLLSKSKERKSKNIDTNSKVRKIRKLIETCNSNQSVCTKCMIIQYIDVFTKDNSRKNGLSAHCNECKNTYRKIRKSNDSMFKLTTNIRSMISTYIKSNGLKKVKSTQEILGCDFNQLKNHLEYKFQKEMNWENYGKWHIDHIIPISYAKCEFEIYKLNHYSNLQPMWSKDNLSKGNRFIG